MNPLSGIAAKLAKNKDLTLEENLNGASSINNAQLKTAMKAADNIILDTADRKIAAKKEINAIRTAQKAEQSKDEKSERTLEIKRRQQSLEEVRAKVAEGASILASVSQHSDILMEFLQKSEIDLGYFESVEAKSKKMQKLILEASNRHKETKLKLSEQQKQIELLSALKMRNRSTIEQLRTELNNAQATSIAQVSEIKAREITIAKLKDDAAALIEKNTSLEDAVLKADVVVEQQVQQLEAYATEVHEQDKLIKNNSLTIKSLTDINASKSLEVTDVQTRYDNLMKKFTELQSTLDDSVYQFDAERKNLEEKLRHRDTRVRELDSMLDVSKLQLVKSEEKIAELAFGLQNNSTDNLVEFSGKTRQKVDDDTRNMQKISAVN